MFTSSMLAEQLASPPPPSITKQQLLIIKGDVPSHLTTAIVAAGQFAKMWNHPFKPKPWAQAYTTSKVDNSRYASPS